MDIKDLHNKFLECSSIVDIDSRSIREGSMFFAIKGDNFDGNEFAEEALNKGAKYAIVDSDSVNIDNSKILRVKDSLGTLQKLATFHRTKTNSIVIALTGSNGKTTSKELIDCILSSNFKTISTKGNYNNHIGVPLSLLQIEDDTEYSVIELGANNFGEIDFLTKITLPDYGYITNFGKAHLEGFIDIEGVIKAKTELYKWIIENNKTLILNFDDKQQKKFRNHKNISFTSEDDGDYKFELISGKKISIKNRDIIYQSNIYGDYNYSNICAAITIGLHFGIDSIKIQDALNSYELQNNRSQILKMNGKEIILDAYNANPTSVSNAIESFSSIKNSKAVILGDMFELGNNSIDEHKKIVKLLSSKNIDSCYFIGEDFYKVKSTNESFYFYRTKEEFYDSSDEILESYVLIKGSRGMKMEEIIENKIK